MTRRDKLLTMNDESLILSNLAEIEEVYKVIGPKTDSLY